MPGEEYLVALGHIPGDGSVSDPVSPMFGVAGGGSTNGDSSSAGGGSSSSNTNTAKRRSLWSGFKQMFKGGSNNRHTSAPPPQGYGGGGKMSRDHPPQSLSYSCLGGNGRRRDLTEDEDCYRTMDGEGSDGFQQRLSRNLSLSHESVFQMEPHTNQAEDCLQQTQPKMIYHRSYSSTHHLPPTSRPTSYVQHTGPQSSQPTAVPPRMPAMALQVQSELAMVLRERHYRGEDDIFSSNRGGSKSGGGGGYSDRSGVGNYSDGDPEKGKRSLDLTDDEDLGLPKSLQNSPGDFSDEGGRSKGWRGSRDHSWNRNLSTGSNENSWSRHHSSCSDNSLLSLDSYETRLDRDKSPPRSDGKLSHKAALHKMAVRPKRNHASRPRRMQQVTEESNPSEPFDPVFKPVLEESTNKFKPVFTEQTNTMQKERPSRISPDLERKKRDAKTKSLDSMFRGQAAPSPEMLAALAAKGQQLAAPLDEAQQQEQNRKHNQSDTESSFLSRLFGSKRSKSRTPRESVEKSPRALPKHQAHEQPPSDNQHAATAVSHHPQPLGLPVPELSPTFIQNQDNIHKSSAESKKPAAPQPQKVSPSATKWSSTKSRAPAPPPPNYSPPSYKKPPLQSASSDAEEKQHQYHSRTLNSTNKSSISSVNKTSSASNITTGGVVTKSHSFRSMDSSAENFEYPSLPVQVPYNDIILKKNKSLSSVLESSEDTKNYNRMKFHSSIQNWSHANEGLKRSISSLAPQCNESNPVPNNAHSNESLKTITSLLEEPDILVQTRVAERNQNGKNNEQNNISSNDTNVNSRHHQVNSFYDVIFEKEFSQVPEKPDLSKLIHNPLDFVADEPLQDSSIDSFQSVGGGDRSLEDAFVSNNESDYHFSNTENAEDTSDNIFKDDLNIKLDCSFTDKDDDLEDECFPSYAPNSFDDNKLETNEEKFYEDASAIAEINATEDIIMGGVVAGEIDLNQSQDILAPKFVDSVSEMQCPSPLVLSAQQNNIHPVASTHDSAFKEQFDVQNLKPDDNVTYGAIIPPPHSPLNPSSPPLHQHQEKKLKLAEEKFDAVKKTSLRGIQATFNTTITPTNQNNETKTVVDEKGLDCVELNLNEEKLLPEINEGGEGGDHVILDTSASTTLMEPTVGNIKVPPVAVTATPLHASGPQLHPTQTIKDQIQNQQQHEMQQQKHNDFKADVNETKDNTILDNICVDEVRKDVSATNDQKTTNYSVKDNVAEHNTVDKIHENILKDTVFNGSINKEDLKDEKSGSGDVIDEKEEPQIGKVNDNLAHARGSNKVDKTKIDDCSKNFDKITGGGGNVKENDTVLTSNSKLDDNDITEKEVVSPKKPAVSAKPVPAPRHFFLKPLNDEPKKESELENVFARRSRSIRNLREVKDFDSSHESKADSHFARSKSARNLGETHRQTQPTTPLTPPELGDSRNSNSGSTVINTNNSISTASNSQLTDQLLNVKERAKSFTNNITPQPFRPKPTNIPPKPKLAIKPVPAPRTFRSMSSANLSGHARLPSVEIKPGSKSASNILNHTVKKQDDLTNAEPMNSENVQPTQQQQSPDILSDIYVRKLRQSFLSSDIQKNVSPTTDNNTTTIQQSSKEQQPSHIPKRVLKSPDSNIANAALAASFQLSPVSGGEHKPSLPEKPTRRIREMSVERQLQPSDQLVPTTPPPAIFNSKMAPIAILNSNMAAAPDQLSTDENVEMTAASEEANIKAASVMSIISRLNAMAL